MEISVLQDLLLEGKLKVTTDTRKLRQGDCYIPIIGEKFDGHTYINKALELGAAGIIEEPVLYDLVKFKLDKIRPKVIGVTGSSGKSTVTRFLYELLSSTNKTCLGPLNTKLGLSLSVINDMSFECEFFVAEMAMDKAGELAYTTELFNPDIAVITTINEAHLEKLGSIEAIVNAKFEITKYLHKSGTLVLNADNKLITDYFSLIADKPQVCWFGVTSTKAEVSADVLKNVHLNILGDHNLYNVLAALAVIKSLGLNVSDYLHLTANLKLPKGRLNKLEGINDSIILDDTHNANPVSVKAALNVLKNFESKRKIVIIGDMLELGSRELPAHKEVAKELDELNPDLVITVGKLGRIIYDNLTLHQKFHLDKSEDFSQLLNTDFAAQKGDVILVKGSQGARMEKVTKLLLKELSKASELLTRQDASWQS